MASAIEMTCIEDFVKGCDLVKYREKEREFEYKLNDKAAKAKLIKGAKRIPFEVVANSLSTNLVFSLGAWNKIVMPFVLFLSQAKEGNKNCKVGDIDVTIASVKTGIETSGKHIDTQVVFFVDREKSVCHFYNTTQLILVNGHGYAKLIEIFLKPFF